MNDILSNSPVFRTDVALFSPGSTASSLLFYPFDGQVPSLPPVYARMNIVYFYSFYSYLAELLLFAQDATTGDTVGVVFGKTRGVAVYLSILLFLVLHRVLIFKFAALILAVSRQKSFQDQMYTSPLAQSIPLSYFQETDL